MGGRVSGYKGTNQDATLLSAMIIALLEKRVTSGNWKNTRDNLAKYQSVLAEADKFSDADKAELTVTLKEVDDRLAKNYINYLEMKLRTIRSGANKETVYRDTIQKWREYLKNKEI